MPTRRCARSTADEDDVFNARAQGFPAALVLSRPGEATEDQPGEVRIAFDGNAVLSTSAPSWSTRTRG
jgi:hypothetical protein